MIQAEIFYEGPVIRGFVISGHAYMAPCGEDLVCASVSALGQTALLGLDAYLNTKISWEIDDAGRLECLLPENLPDEELRAAQVVIHTMELGLLAIEESYGQFLKVRKRRWTPCCSR
jgi:uncharacterized protein YsxB (DUF464 family)